MTVTKEPLRRDADRLLVIAGPCLAESRDVLLRVADHLVKICAKLPVQLVFKASYRKANRTSVDGFQGVGDDVALGWMAEVKRDFGVPLLTDIHADAEAAMAAEVVDVLQIPAFLSRQTSLIEAAAHTGCVVNIKKAQFMAPDDMAKAAAKAERAGASEIWLTERGTSFGYHDLVVDYRGLVIMKATGLPVIFDATHSVQQPSIGATSGGKREFIPYLASAAMAVGVDGLFFETHPDPSSAASDRETQVPLTDAETLLHRCLKIREALR